MSKTERPTEFNDPAVYAACQVPHESEEAATAAYEAFWLEVYAARQKHRISNVFMVSALISEPHPEDFQFRVSGMGSEGVCATMSAIGLKRMKQAIANNLDDLATVATGDKDAG